MDLEERGINAGNWVDSAQDRDYWRFCECGIEPPGSVSQGDLYEDLGVDGRTLSEYILKKLILIGGIKSAQDRDYWTPLVIEAFNLRVPEAMEVGIDYFLDNE